MDFSGTINKRLAVEMNLLVFDLNGAFFNRLSGDWDDESTRQKGDGTVVFADEFDK